MMPFISTTRTLEGFPRLYVTWRQERFPPFRRCARAVAVRVPFTRRALVFGVWWGRLTSEDDAMSAIGLRGTDLDVPELLRLERERAGKA